MNTRRRHFPLLALVATVLIIGTTAGVIFGERSIPEDETQVVLRASRIVNDLMEWLPDETEPADIVYDGIHGMLEVLDPHSNYLDPRSFQRMRARQEGSFFGVGIIISRRNGKVTVIAPMAGTPAAQKGLRTGDIISAVGGEPTEDRTLDEVVDLVRGPEGSTVLLTMTRPGMETPFDVEITRARIPQDSVRFAFMLRPEVGYIRLSEFSNTSVREVREAMTDLASEGMTSLVLDLRNNPGGPLDAAVGISDAFLVEGQLVVTTRGRTPENNARLTAPGRGEPFQGPLLILVNQGSASASEIVAGAVQDHDRGLVIGEVTWGKGLVQTVYTVRDTGLALTTARYYTPSGRSIQRPYDSFIDYITHRNGSSAGDESADIYETDAGRTVLGGGGITPDVEITGRLLSEEVARLYGNTAFFRFGVELLKEIPEEEQPAFATEFEADSDVVNEFFDWIASEEILTADQAATLRGDDLSMGDVARAIHVEILNAALGLEDGFKVAIGADEQILTALEYLPDATDMATEFFETHE
jgi:carboxyl-terminal processing protease